jgi:hypothetical protein
MREPNLIDLIARILGIILLAVAATDGRQPEQGAASNPAQAPIMATPTPFPGGDMTARPVPHVIERVDALILESMPPQISLDVVGYQPDGCDFPVLVTQARSGNTITVNIYREVPPGVMCTMQIMPYQQTIRLDGTFDPGTYTISVNNQTISVTI